MNTGNNNSHVVKGFRTNAKRDLAAYDQLPRALRDALKEAPTDFAAERLLGVTLRPERLSTYLKALAKASEEHFDGKKMGRVWGPGHPQARGATAQTLGL